MSRKLTQEEFVERSIAAHKENYDYSKAEYKGRVEKVEITCKRHGITFTQLAGEHMSGKTACPICILEKKSATRLKTQSEACPAGHKICTKCSRTLPYEAFSVASMGAGGRYSVCRECCSKRAKDVRKNEVRRQEMNAKGREYYRENSEKIMQRTLAYQKANRPLYNLACRNWGKRNPHKIKSNCSKRRASKLQAIPKWVDKEWEDFLIEEIHHQAGLLRHLTGIEHHVDHIVPLKSELVCGLHYSENLQLLTAKENLVKGNRYWPDMP